MNEERFQQNSPSEDRFAIKRCSVKEALTYSPVDLPVEDGKEIYLTPYEPEFANHFLNVTLSTFDDLKALSLVPHGLPEEKVRAAIISDDQEANRNAQQLVMNQVPSHCSCENSDAHSTKSYGSRLRASYRDARANYHPALSTLLSEHYNAKVAWDSPLPGIVKKWTERISLTKSSNYSIIVAMFRDITIGRGAALIVDPADRALFAGAIRIHQTGRLVYRGSYLKVWANSIEHFRDWNIPHSTTTTENLPWFRHI